MEQELFQKAKNILFGDIEGGTETSIGIDKSPINITSTPGGERTRAIQQCKLLAKLLNNPIKLHHNLNIWIIDVEGNVAKLK